MIKLIKLFGNLKVVLAVMVAGLGLWVQSLRMDKIKVNLKLAKGKVKAVLKAVKSQKEAREITSEHIEEAKERRSNGIYRDLK